MRLFSSRRVLGGQGVGRADAVLRGQPRRHAGAIDERRSFHSRPQQRVALVPCVPSADRCHAHAGRYIYTAWRQAFDTGLSLLRPLYYDFPLLDGAYWATETGAYPQYMFGDSIMVRRWSPSRPSAWQVSPIVAPMDNETQLATQSIWIPPGTWSATACCSLSTTAPQVRDDERRAVHGR